MYSTKSKSKCLQKAWVEMDCDRQKVWHNPDDIFVLLTKYEGRTGRILARGLDITDLTVHTKKTEV